MTVPIKPVAESKKSAQLYYGDPGCGKTTLIGSGGNEFDILIIRPPMDHTDSIIGSGVKEAVVRDWEDTWDVEEQLRHMKAGDLPDIVCLDSISLFQDVSLNDAYQAALDRAGIPGSAARKHRQSFGPDKGEFRISAERISELVRNLVGMDSFHVIITAHPFWAPRLKTDEDDEGETPTDLQIQPYIQVKNMVSKICGYMNIVGYMEVVEATRGNKTVTQRRIRTNAGSFHYAKNQYNLPGGGSVFGESGIIINPTLPKIMAAINQAKKSAPASGRPTRRRTRRS